jgi:hypothetical protein
MIKYPVYILLILIVTLSGCSAKKSMAKSELPVEVPTPPSVNYAEQSTWLLGYFNRSQLIREPHSEWFIKGYDDYQYNSGVVEKLSAISKYGITIKIILGTWCPDSRREVPRFMRILDGWKFSQQMLTFIGVDNDKQSPVGEYIGLGIERVPTFIIYRNNIEAGRIIENPLTSLEQDMVNILTRNE